MTKRKRERVVEINYEVINDDAGLEWYVVSFVGENGFQCDYMTDDPEHADKTFNKPPRYIP